MDKPGPPQSMQPEPPSYAENMDQREPQPDFAAPPPYAENMDKRGSPQDTKLPPGFAPPPAYTDAHKAPPILTVFVDQRAGFGPGSRKMTCSYCKAFISTRVKLESSTKTHLFALLVCLTGFWLCMPCVYCMDCSLVKKHYCPKCKVFLGQCDD